MNFRKADLIVLTNKDLSLSEPLGFNFTEYTLCMLNTNSVFFYRSDKASAKTFFLDKADIAAAISL
jgi:hypothetical protein